MKELKKDISIIILPADKEKSTVILNRSVYKLKALDLLNDRHSYRISTKGEFASHTRSANKALELHLSRARIHSLVNRNNIDRVANATPPRELICSLGIPP